MEILTEIIFIVVVFLVTAVFLMWGVAEGTSDTEFKRKLAESKRYSSADSTTAGSSGHVTASEVLK